MFTGQLPEFWLFALGGLFIAVTLFLPRGLVGLVRAPRPTEPSVATRSEEALPEEVPVKA